MKFKAFRETSIGGVAYLRNIVHLPFYLQNAGLRKVQVAQQMAGNNHRYKSSTWFELESKETRKMSNNDSDQALISKGKSSRVRRSSVSSVSSVGSKFNFGLQTQTDITKVVATDDYMSDVNIKSMRRLMNVVNVMSRLMRAFHLDFNWNHLAAWVHITEQWPYRMSWIIFYVETADEHKFVLADSTPLLEIYHKIRSSLPSHRDLEPLLDMDRDEKKLEAILKLKNRTITVRSLKVFLPFSINLDPYIKKVIHDEYVSLAALEGSETGFGWFTNTSTNEKKQEVSHAVAPRSVARKISTAVPPGGQMSTNPVPQQQMFTHHHLPPAYYNDFMMSPPQRTASPLSPVDLPSEITEKPLSKRSVEEVCSLLRQIDGLMPTRVDTYCDAIASQNISGAVLAHCSLTELKSVLNMNFGDWEMFQLVLTSLRHHEKKQEMRPTLHIMRAKPPPAKKIATSSAAESAINMEEALISGLLSQLNEDAQADVITDEILEERKPSGAEAIYISRSRGGAMTTSIGSEDAFNSLEKGYPSSLSLVLDSQPSSPSKAVTSTTQAFSSRPTSSVRVKTRHLRDRLDSLASEKNDNEPYAWISQTAPSSPLIGRSRSGSIFGEEAISESTISVGNLGEKVKKTIKNALKGLDQPANALPPVHRARDVSEENGSSRSSFVSRLKPRGSLSNELHRQHSNFSSSRTSIELPIFGEEEGDEPKDNASCSSPEESPEQETVLPKSTSIRPHIQNLFSEAESSTSSKK